jgi:hypothetical protein
MKMTEDDWFVVAVGVVVFLFLGFVLVFGNQLPTRGDCYVTFGAVYAGGHPFAYYDAPHWTVYYHSPDMGYTPAGANPVYYSTNRTAAMQFANAFDLAHCGGLPDYGG